MAGVPSDLPREGDILAGTVVRIETYGAFCRLDTQGRRPVQGLVHISQLVPDQRVERVEDVVSVEDRVWVKVLNVEMDPSSQRWRIQLSRKEVSQDGMATDLGLERESREIQRNQLESNLNSMIGMGVALDPMANRLTMKHSKNSHHGTTTFRGGYSLVGDDEGEPEPELPTVAESSTVRTQVAPLGRGRGTTLPAWMTQASSEGPTGQDQGDKPTTGDSSDEDGRKKKKRDKKKTSKEYRKHSRKHSSSRDRKRKKSRHDHCDRDDDDSASSGRYSSEKSLQDDRRRSGKKQRKDEELSISSNDRKDKRKKKKGHRSRRERDEYHVGESDSSSGPSSRRHRSHRQSRS